MGNLGRASRRLLVSAVVGAAAAAGAIVALPAADAGAATSGSATAEFSYVAATAPYTTLYRRTAAGTTSVTTSVTTTSPVLTLASSPAGILYTIGNSDPGADHLETVAEDGTVTDLGPVQGLTGSSFAAAGFDTDGTLWVSGGGTVFAIDVATLTVERTLTVSAIGDIAFAGGWMFATGGSRSIARIDPATGARTTFSFPELPTIPVTAFWSARGHLYLAADPTLYEVVDYDTAPRLVAITTLESRAGDGASDPTGPNPFLAAVDDDLGTIVRGGASGASIRANDIVGAPVRGEAVTATLVSDPDSTGASLAPDATLVIPADAPLGGHTVTYRVCSTDIAGLCDTATATFTVEAPAGSAPGSTATPSPGAAGPAASATDSTQAAGTPGSAATGELAATGSPAAAPAVFAALLLLGAGAAVGAVALVRRRIARD